MREQASYWLRYGTLDIPNNHIRVDYLYWLRRLVREIGRDRGKKD